MKTLNKLTTKELENLFHGHFNTTHICVDLLDLISNSKKRQYIIDKFKSEFSKKGIKNLLEDL